MPLNDEAARVIRASSPGRRWSAGPRGDRYLLIEYGEPVLDLNLRFRVQELLHGSSASSPQGIIDLTPGIRSLQIHYDSGKLPRAQLLGDCSSGPRRPCRRSTT